MTRSIHAFGMRIGRRIILSLLAASITASSVLGQEASSPTDSIRAGGIEWRFATAEQGRDLLKQDDVFTKQMSAFDRKVRMQSEDDPGKAAFLQFAAKDAIEWPASARAAVQKAIETLDEQLGELELPDIGPVFLVHTSGHEESGAAYTRGSTIVLPKGMTGSIDKPPRRLITHELFHVLSRSDPKLRDRLYSIIGFRPTGEIPLPKELADRRMTNPDAPRIEHVIELRVSEKETVMAAPVLYAKSEFDPQKPSLFHYIEFQLMEVVEIVGKQWIPKTRDGKPVLHSPSNPDFHRQIGSNTKYIIHPEEILADNFVALVTGAEVKDRWIIDAMRDVLDKDQATTD